MHDMFHNISDMSSALYLTSNAQVKVLYKTTVKTVHPYSISIKPAHVSVMCCLTSCVSFLLSKISFLAHYGEKISRFILLKKKKLYVSTFHSQSVHSHFIIKQNQNTTLYETTEKSIGFRIFKSGIRFYCTQMCFSTPTSLRCSSVIRSSSVKEICLVVVGEYQIRQFTTFEMLQAINYYNIAPIIEI